MYKGQDGNKGWEGQCGKTLGLQLENCKTRLHIKHVKAEVTPLKPGAVFLKI